VFSTLSMMHHTLEYINENHAELILYNLKAEKETIKKYCRHKELFPLVLMGTEKSEQFNFKGFRWIDEQSEITGSAVRKYSDEPVDVLIPLYNEVKVTKYIMLPFAYFIPPQFTNIIEVLRSQHIKYFRFRRDKSVVVERYRFKNISFHPYPYEGRQLPKYDVDMFEEEVVIPVGSVWVPVDQRQLKVIVHLLEPESPDSLVSWGFFNAFFERKEYAESYVMEPYAKMMIENDPTLKEEFLQKLNVRSLSGIIPQNGWTFSTVVRLFMIRERRFIRYSELRQK
jgi:hypothetical protein